MKSNSLKFLLSAGLFLVPAMSLQAGLDARLKVDVNCYFQAKTSVAGGVQSGKTGIVRLDAKNLLVLIGKDKGIKFANGAQLIVNDQGNVRVGDSGGNAIMDVSNLVRFEFQKSDELLQGKINLTNGKEDSRTYYPLSMILNLSTLKGTLKGIGVEDRLVTSPDGDSVQIIRGNTDSDVSGKGTINGGLGYFEGTVNLKGRNASVN